MPDSSTAIIALLLGYGVTLLLIRWVLLSRGRQPQSSIAWILAIIVLPYLGGILYLFFGVNRVQRRRASRRRALERIAQKLPSFQAYAIEDEEEIDPSERELSQLVTATVGTRITSGNRLEVMADTNRTFGLIEQAILEARDSIHLEYYIWRADRSGQRLRDLLIEKAKQGVKIRFLYDSFGSILLRRHFLDPMRRAGIHVATFLPGRTFRERWSVNLRNHRKIVIVDGKIGFTGGMNIGDEYLGRIKKLGYWRDTHVRVEGPAVLHLQHVFVEDWFYATSENLSDKSCFPPPRQDGDQLLQVVSGGPDGDMRPFHPLFFSAINAARERLTVVTSYFVPTEALMMALMTAAYRGVDVRLLVPGRSAHFYPWTVVAGRSFYDELLQAGVTIHEYNRGILHAKTLTIDSTWSLISTANFDARSMLLNFEVGVISYNRSIAEELERHYEDDLEFATPITLRSRSERPLRHVFAENLFRLFAPIM